MKNLEKRYDTMVTLSYSRYRAAQAYEFAQEAIPFYWIAKGDDSLILRSITGVDYIFLSAEESSEKIRDKMGVGTKYITEETLVLSVINLQKKKLKCLFFKYLRWRYDRRTRLGKF